MSKIGGSFYQKIRFKYKLSILNENTLEEIWHIRLSKLNVFLVSFLVAILYFFLIAFLIIKTPLRSFLPGYTDNLNLRKQVLLEAVRVDSITEVMHAQHQYIEVLRGVMAGEIFVDSSANVKSLLKQETAKINLERSKKEAEFCSEFENTEKYNIAVIDNKQTDVNYLMHRPAKGVIDKKYNDKKQTFGISVVIGPKSNIFSVLDGVVIFSGYDPEGNFVLQIQHTDDLVSVYKIKYPFLKKVGDKVQVGEILTTLKEEGTDLSFELWKKGKPLNPEDYITF